MKRRQPSKQAKILTDDQFQSFLDYVSSGEHPLRDRVMLLLSYKAGLRASEISLLDWSSVTDARGKLRTDYLRVVGKRDKVRTVPIHPELRSALYEFKQSLRSVEPTDRLMYAAKGGFMSTNNVTVYLWLLYRSAGFQGASSHSGRRTMITKSARIANLNGCSIKDVQLLAGHSFLKTTLLYVEPSDQVSRLIRNL